MTQQTLLTCLHDHFDQAVYARLNRYYDLRILMNKMEAVVVTNLELETEVNK